MQKTGQKPAARRVAKALSLTEQAYQYLRREIITCALAPGAEIGEQELAARLDMSKTPVREALARLILEGLVEAFPRRGYRVTPVTLKDVNDIFLVRSALEGQAAELAAQRMSAADLDRLEALGQAHYTPGEVPTVDAFVKVNDAFHRAIAEASGVPRLVLLVTAYLEESTRFFHMGAIMRDVNPETREDHARIVAALRRRDPAAARLAVVAHSENTRRGLLSALVADPNSALLL